MFFTLKILAMFFFSIPLIEYFMSSNTMQPVDLTEFFIPMIIIFSTLTFIGLLWIFFDKRRGKNKAVPMLEILLFYIMCFSSVWCSGGITSYYKFVFVFLIVLYTFEYGMKLGMSIAVLSSLTLLSMDLVSFDGKGINTYFENDLVLSAVFIIVAWTLGFYVKMEKMQIKKLKSDANIDGLTQTFNHRYFYEKIEKLCLDFKETKNKFALLMLDIDYFKTYNDIYGHQQGDDALRFLADLINKNISENDILCRYGGEEFAIILNNYALKEAIEFAENLCLTIANTPFKGQEHLPNGNFTVSIGVSEFKGEKDSYKDLINRADTALYRAKFLRRNSVEVYSSIFEEFHSDNDHDQNMHEMISSLKTLITVINSRDLYTFNHVERVVYLCKEFANFLNLSKKEKKALIFAAYVHDLGKINISKEILISDQTLTQKEWEELRRHPVESVEIIKKIEGTQEIIPIILQHHERYDGNGYPNNYKGEEICYLARILTLADSFDAMTSRRPYQATKTYVQAFDEIRRCSGTQFDPELSEKFIKALEGLLQHKKCDDL